MHALHSGLVRAKCRLITYLTVLNYETALDKWTKDEIEELKHMHP